MINHLRTVVLNLSANEYLEAGITTSVSYDFQPVTSKSLVVYRDGLGLLNSTNILKRYRAFNAVAPVLHSPTFSSYTTLQDSRITYMPNPEAGDMTIAGVLDSIETSAATLSGYQLVKDAGKVYPDLPHIYELGSYFKLASVIVSYSVLYEVRNGNK